MSYGKPSRTGELLADQMHGRLVVDQAGLVHWYAPRGFSDSRPWTNPQGGRALARTLRPVEGPSWADLLRLARAVRMPPRRMRSEDLISGAGPGHRGWNGASEDELRGWHLETWRFANDAQGQLRVNAWFSRVDDRGGIQAGRQAYDTTPAGALTAAVQTGVLDGFELRMRTGAVLRLGVEPRIRVEL